MVLLDFSQAFDSLNHSLILHKLPSCFGFSSLAVDFVKDYLSDRFHVVCIVTHCYESLINRASIPRAQCLRLFCFPSMLMNRRAVLVRLATTSSTISSWLCLPCRLEARNWMMRFFVLIKICRDRPLGTRQFSEAWCKDDVKWNISWCGWRGCFWVESFRTPTMFCSWVFPWMKVVRLLKLLVDIFQEFVVSNPWAITFLLRHGWLTKLIVVPTFTYGECVYSTNLRDQQMRGPRTASFRLVSISCSFLNVMIVTVTMLITCLQLPFWPTRSKVTVLRSTVWFGRVSRLICFINSAVNTLCLIVFSLLEAFVEPAEPIVFCHDNIRLLLHPVGY